MWDLCNEDRTLVICMDLNELRAAVDRTHVWASRQPYVACILQSVFC